MKYFFNFLNSGEHLSYVLSSYGVVFFILFLIFFISFRKTRKLEKEFLNFCKDEEKK